MFLVGKHQKRLSRGFHKAFCVGLRFLPSISSRPYLRAPCTYSEPAGCSRCTPHFSAGGGNTPSRELPKILGRACRISVNAHAIQKKSRGEPGTLCIGR